MKRKASEWKPKRVGAAGVIAAMLLETVSPAVHAVSTNYAGFVSQVPGVWTAPPDPNVMFTLDDSGSMRSDAIPDLPDPPGSGTTLDTIAGLRRFSTLSPSYPDMWNAATPSDAASGTTYLSTTYFQSSNKIARYLRSSAGNPLYYNRAVTYTPWPVAGNNTTLNLAASTSAVNIHTDDPFNTTRQINLTARQNVSGGSGAADNEANNYYYGTYYVYNGATPLPLATPDSPLNVVGNFTKVEIKSSVATYYRAATRTDCSGAVGAGGCTYAQELQNFANWLQYYRNRRLMSKGGVAAAFAKQGTGLRVGYTEISNNSDTPLRGVRQFTGSDRTSFFNLLYGASGTGRTPLRQSMDRVGRYFSSTGTSNPWAENPGTSVGTEYSCRRSFHIMATDGYWTDETAVTSAARNNVDDLSGSTPAKPDGTTYAFSNSDTSTTDPLVGRFAIDPYRDSTSDTLADVAAYYWKNDLRTNIDNNVPPSSRDPAFWQHLTTYTVGLGVNGTGLVTKAIDGTTADLSTQASRDALVASKTRLTWTSPPTSGNVPATGDDLIHASMNGHGQYFSVTSPTEMANELNKALTEVTDQAYDLASAAADSPQVRTGSHLYQSTYSPAQWYGRLYAFAQQANGIVNNKPTSASYTNPDQVWEASNKMPAAGSRSIFTYNAQVASPRGRSFAWANLNNAQQSYLVGLSAPGTLSAAQITLGQTTVDYLRGSSTNEVANGGTMRDRSRYTVAGVTGGVLGDVVNGSPVKGPDAGGGYDRLPSSDAASSSYSAFRSGSTLDNMRGTIFLGSNDGMLHAFNLTDGVERFAYVPNSVYNVPRSTNAGAPGVAEQKLKMLSDTTYSHRFTVDGPPNIGDAYLGGSWKTILAASTGAGARSVFTIDVTNTQVVAGGFDQSKIMWEFSEADNAGMGFVIGYPHIVRMRNGSWAAVFGNGYDSTGGQARLFVLDLATGAVIREFAVGVAGDNGLSQPNFIVNANREVTAIYAGDLKGNLWKFDVSDPLAANWKVAFGTAPNYTPLFTTSGNQPITVMPEITAHTDPAGGALISFGTGKLFEASDTAAGATNVNLSTQALYGVWDKPGDTGGLTSTSLLQQTAPTIVSPAIFGSTSTSTPTWSTQRGWFMNLGSGGERVNLPPQQVKSVLFMVANKPIVDPCSNGGSSRIFALDPLTGAIPNFGVFDTNGDGVFDSSDNSSYNVRQISSGLLTQPIFQLPAQTAYSAPLGSTLSPFALFDRGQATAARGGGVELSRSGGGTLGPGTVTNECALLMTAAQSNTSLMSMYINTCLKPPSAAKARISWRQLK